MLTQTQTTTHKGWNKGQQRRILTHRLGPWGWNTDYLHAKIVENPLGECWIWTGNSNKYGNLFGAYYNDNQRMIQANRIIYMEYYQKDVSDYAVYMSCGNHHCCNPQHMTLNYNKRKFKSDGVTPAENKR